MAPVLALTCAHVLASDSRPMRIVSVKYAFGFTGTGRFSVAQAAPIATL